MNEPPSPYCHRYDLADGGCAVFHALSLDVAYLGSSHKDHFRPLDSRPLPFDPAFVRDVPQFFPTPATAPAPLMDLGFFVGDGSFDKAWLERLRSLTRVNPIKMLTVVPTAQCNFDCVYCHQPPETRRNPLRMTIPQAERFLAAWGVHARKAPGKKDLLIYGGEPLINGPLVRWLIEHVAAADESLYGGRVEVILVTNASLITPEWAAFFARHDTFVIVSCDGVGEVNDRARFDMAGRGTFHHVERGWRNLEEAGVRAAISVTVTRRHAPDIDQSFLDTVARFQPIDLGLNSCLHPPYGQAENAWACPPLEGTRRMLEAYAGARAQGVYVEQFNRRIRPFALQLHRVKDCSSCGGRIVVQPDDRWSPCDSFSFTKEHCWPFTGTFDLERPEYQEWTSLSPIHWPACHDCPCVALCGGGCRYDGAMASGSLSGLYPHRCIQDREILRWILEDLGRMVGASRLGPDEVRIPTEAERQALLGRLALDPCHVPLGNANRYGEEVGRQDDNP